MPDKEKQERRAAAAIRPPKTADHDADWHGRIERARRARDEGRKARAGKPAVFSIQQAL